MNSTRQSEEFWHSGAFLRLGSGSVLTWQGPWREAVKNSKLSIGYMEYFANSPRYWQVAAQAQSWTPGRILESPLCAVESFGSGLAERDFATADEQAFSLGFAQVMQKIQRGEIDKAVPMTTRTCARAPSLSDKQRWLRKVLEAPSALHAFGFWDADSGVIGATPEVLFMRSGQTVQTMALAGTLARDPARPQAEQDFLRDPKETREHRFVVEDLREQLSPLGRVELGQTGLLELPTLVHLHTPITLHLRADLDLAQIDDVLINKLHPTAALGVMPRKYGYRFLQDLPSQMTRGGFGAPILYQISENESIALVQIRSVHWGKDHCSVSAGCGVVAQSLREREWQELTNKLNSIFKILGMR